MGRIQQICDFQDCREDASSAKPKAGCKHSQLCSRQLTTTLHLKLGSAAGKKDLCGGSRCTCGRCRSPRPRPRRSAQQMPHPAPHGLPCCNPSSNHRPTLKPSITPDPVSTLSSKRPLLTLKRRAFMHALPAKASYRASGAQACEVYAALYMSYSTGDQGTASCFGGLSLAPTL